MKTLCFLVTFSLTLTSIQAQNFYTTDESPEKIGRMITEDLLSRQDFMMYETSDCISVHYAEVCAGFGAARLAGLLNDSATLARLSTRYMRVLDEGIMNTANHVDANVYGILPLELYIQTGNQIFYDQGIELADIQWADPLDNGMTSQTRFWIDDLWMIGSLQTQAFRATDNVEYLDRAALEFAAYLEKLQSDNGLFHHGEGAPFFWGRGNGWAAAGIAELLSELPKSNPHYKEIEKAYKKMMHALREYQSPDGMWLQLIDEEDFWKETSGTAMFGYAITLGVKSGILSKKKFTPVYEKAWLALVKHVNADGQLTDVCVGTGKSDQIDHYRNRPKVTGDFHGQAPMLWFAWALLAE